MSSPSITPASPAGVTVRPATPADIPLIVALVRELAEYEELTEAVDSTSAHFETCFFGPTPRVFCEIAALNGVAGGFAVWFYNFSTFRGRHGIYLEDLYARPSMRGHGLGKALLQSLAARCVAEDLPRLEWSVLDWNTPAIAFYRAQGAVLLDDWTTCRISGDALARLGHGR